MIRNVVLLATAAVLVGLLAACSSGASGPTYTEEQFDAAVGGAASDASVINAEVQSDDSVAAVAQMPGNAPGGVSVSGSLSTQSGSSMLAPSFAGTEAVVGEYTWDDVNQVWVEDTSYAGDDLVLNWTFDRADGTTGQARFVLDWDARGATVTGTNELGDTVQLPVAATATLWVDGAAVADVHYDATWYDCAAIGGYVSDALSQYLDGTVGVPARVTLDQVGYEVTATSLTSSGAVTLHDGADYAKFSWLVDAQGNLVRGSDCFADDFEVDSMTVDFDVEVAKDGSSDSLGFGMTVSDLGTATNTDTGATMTTAAISYGRVRVGGSTAITFAGTFDDANWNGTPGDNVTLNFAGGQSTTLEAYLTPSTTALRALKVFSALY